MVVQRVLNVSFYGLPNVGKSSLLNALLKEKVSAVSSKAHTTKEGISGVITEGNTQVVFIDVPGLVRPGTKGIGTKISRNAKAGVFGADVVCFVLDATNGLNDNAVLIIQECKTHNKVIIVAINKMDKARNHSLILDFAKKVTDAGLANEIFFISAKTKRGIENLKEYLFSFAKDGPWMHEKNEITNKTIDYRLGEITREKLFKNLHHEVPHDIKVITEEVKDEQEKFVIHQTICVRKKSQKPIVLGKQGLVIKKIADFAVKDMEKLLKKKVALSLFVKVEDVNNKT